MEQNQDAPKVEPLKAVCGFKTLKAEDKKTILRKFREQVTVTFPKLSIEEVPNHARFAAFLEAAIIEEAKGIIQKRERIAAEVAANPDYIHDMQAEANEITLDLVMNAALDRAARNGGLSKEDVEGWWKEVAGPATRQYYVAGKGYEATKAATACAFLYSKLLAVHSGRLNPDETLQKSLIVNLERMTEHKVRDYLLGKLKGTKVESEEEMLAMID